MGSETVFDAAVDENVQSEIVEDQNSLHSTVSEERASISEEACGIMEDEESSKCVCILCDKTRKTFKSRVESLHACVKNATFDKIISALNQIKGENAVIVAREAFEKGSIIYYHKKCLNKYDSKDKTEDEESKSEWHLTRERNSDAYNEIFEHVKEKVIRNEKSIFLKELHSKFVQSLNYKDPTLTNFERPGVLKEKLLKKFSNEISIVTFNNKLLVKPSKLTIVEYDDLKSMHDNEILEKAALILHKSIKSIKCNKLPEQITTEDLIQGECETPEILEEFYTRVVAGENSQRADSTKTNRIVSSLSQDTIYAVSNATIKPKKQITLGIAVKGLTNSRKVLEILNRYGQCCSYSKLEELETEATFTACSLTESTPPDMERNPNLCTALAFDNFDL